jgi:hypothetical protein
MTAKIVSFLTTESTKHIEVGREEGVPTAQNPTPLYLVRLCGLCDLCGEKSYLPVRATASRGMPGPDRPCQDIVWSPALGLV